MVRLQAQMPASKIETSGNPRCTKFITPHSSNRNTYDNNCMFLNIAIVYICSAASNWSKGDQLPFIVTDWHMKLRDNQEHENNCIVLEHYWRAVLHVVVQRIGDQIAFHCNKMKPWDSVPLQKTAYIYLCVCVRKGETGWLVSKVRACKLGEHVSSALHPLLLWSSRHD
jgi:hypothetical protein